MQELFAVAAPGLETAVAAELQGLGHSGVAQDGGVLFKAPYDAILPLNRALSVSSRILMRFASFRCVHLAELTKLTRRLPWCDVLRPNARVRIKATCRKSKIYHSGAAAQRVRDGIEQVVALAAPEVSGDDATTNNDAGIQEILVRIERDICELSINASGEHLHRRGYKLETAKAPLRETLASGLLAMCDWSPGEALLDPMCGSGTFIIEAARQAQGIQPGMGRAFACEVWPAMAKYVRKQRAGVLSKAACAAVSEAVAQPAMLGFDRDAGAVAGATNNATRAGVLSRVSLQRQPLAALKRPDGAPGLVICNPPWGERVGDRRTLRNLYATLGHVMRGEMHGWRLGLVTSQPMLAQATGLAYTHVSEPLLHGGVRIRLYRFG